PAEGERGEDVTDRATRQIVSALRSRYEIVVIDCGAQLGGAGAAAVEMADTGLLVTTPDVIAVRGAKRAVRMWDRLQIRKAEETTVVVNRHTRSTKIQPALIQRITGSAVAATAVPSHFKELQGVVDAARVHELEAKSTVKQALWGLAGELGLVKPTEGAHRAGRLRGDRGAVGFRRRKEHGTPGKQAGQGGCGCRRHRGHVTGPAAARRTGARSPSSSSACSRPSWSRWWCSGSSSWSATPSRSPGTRPTRRSARRPPPHRAPAAAPARRPDWTSCPARGAAE